MHCCNCFNILSMTIRWRHLTADLTGSQKHVVFIFQFNVFTNAGRPVFCFWCVFEWPWKIQQMFSHTLIHTAVFFAARVVLRLPSGGPKMMRVEAVLSPHQNNNVAFVSTPYPQFVRDCVWKLGEAALGKNSLSDLKWPSFRNLRTWHQ